jgi:hypothetical protein
VKPPATDSLTVNLDSFGAGGPNLSPAAAADLAEAAAVCLLESGHGSGVVMSVIPGGHAVVSFSDPDARAFTSRADPEETTERGATALALELLRVKEGHEVIERSRKRTGCDWYVGQPDPDGPFQAKRRVEVSGIRNETETTVVRRVNQKRAQLARGNDTTTGYVVVVGFRSPVAHVETL